MLQQSSLDGAAADVLATADYQVLDTVDDVEVSLLVDVSHIARFQPAPIEGFRVGIRPLPVAADDGDALDL